MTFRDHRRRGRGAVPDRRQPAAFVSPRDFETQAHSYDVQVTASDGVPAHNTVQNLTVTLTEVNDSAPVFTSSATPSVAENSTAVVTLAATDADTVGRSTFSITGGADAALFTITGGNQLAFIWPATSRPSRTAMRFR